MIGGFAAGMNSSLLAEPDVGRGRRLNLHKYKVPIEHYQ